MSIGFTLPFAKSSGSVGYFETTANEIDAIKQDIHSLLITNWGERVMQYNFGCNMREFMFEQMRDNELKSRIADRIRSQISTWLPFVKLDVLNIFFSTDSPSIPENAIGISMDYRIASKPDLRGSAAFIV